MNALKLVALVRLLMVTAILGLSYCSLSTADDGQSTDIGSVITAGYEGPEAAYLLGELYREGFYVERDYLKALTYYQEAASAAYPVAFFRLGSFFYEALGVEQDYQKAYTYFEQAVEHGVPDANMYLGQMRNFGEGVPQDYSLALKHYQAAADAGILRGGFNVGAMYASGQGVEQDYHESYKWFSWAAENSESRDFIAHAKDFRNRVAAIAGIKIPTKVVPMKGSERFTIFKGQIVEYDPVLSDLPVLTDVKRRRTSDPSGPVLVHDWWRGEKPRSRVGYVSSPRKRPGARANTATHSNRHESRKSFGAPNKSSRTPKRYPRIPGNASAVGGGVINSRNGEFYPEVAGGVINPRNGEFYPEVAGGFINSRNGEFYPDVGGGMINP